MPATIKSGDRNAIHAAVSSAISTQQITDVHTHSYAPAFGAAPNPDALCSGVSMNW